MPDFENLEKEALLFAEDLFSDLMSLHPMFRVYLPEHSPTLGKSSHFTHSISKAVMVYWKNLKKKLDDKFRTEFNSYSKSDAALKQYLEHLCDTVSKTSPCKISQVFGFSAILLELITVLYKRGYTYFLSKAPIYWLLMLQNFAFEEFYKERGWESLTALSKGLEIEYDNSVNEIYWMYFDSDSMLCTEPGQGSKSSNSTEALNAIVTDSASGSVIPGKCGLDALSKDIVETDLEGGNLTKGSVIPKILELTKQFSKKMTLKDENALDSGAKGKLAVSEDQNAALVDESSNYTNPMSEEATKKDKIADIESNMSRSSSAQTERKYHLPPLSKEETVSYSGISEAPKQESPSKTSSGGISSTHKKSSSPAKTTHLTAGTEGTASESTAVQATPTQSASSKDVKTPEEAATSVKAIQTIKDATTVVYAPRQKVSQDVRTTEP